MAHVRRGTAAKLRRQASALAREGARVNAPAPAEDAPKKKQHGEERNMQANPGVWLVAGIAGAPVDVDVVSTCPLQG